MRDYLKAGVRVVWVLDPAQRTVTEHRPKRKHKVYKNGDTLVVPDVIPGFQLAVQEVFAT